MPRASKPLISTMRVEGRPSAPTVASGHRVRLGQFGIERLLQPQRELRHWIGQRCRLVEFGTFVALAQACNLVHAPQYRKAVPRGRSQAHGHVVCRPFPALEFGLTGKALGKAPTSSNLVQLPSLNARTRAPIRPPTQCEPNPSNKKDRMKTQPAVIVLAAGKGSRFLGRDHKLSQHLAHGDRARHDAAAGGGEPAAGRGRDHRGVRRNGAAQHRGARCHRAARCRQPCGRSAWAIRSAPASAPAPMHPAG